MRVPSVMLCHPNGAESTTHGQAWEINGKGMTTYSSQGPSFPLRPGEQVVMGVFHSLAHAY